MPIITWELVQKLTAIKGGQTRAALRMLGVPWPPLNGWKHRAVGTTISDRDFTTLWGFIDGLPEVRIAVLVIRDRARRRA